MQALLCVLLSAEQIDITTRYVRLLAAGALTLRRVMGLLVRDLVVLKHTASR